MGHIQATGTDAAGRKQYRYHDRWRQRQDAAKFDEMLEFARVLPLVRDHVAVDLQRPDMDRERVLACSLRLLDRGFFRIGSESYAEENETYGLATMKKSTPRSTARSCASTMRPRASSGASNPSSTSRWPMWWSG